MGLAAFAGMDGFIDGMGSANQMAAQRAQLQEQQRMAAARRAAGQMLMTGMPPGPQPPMPGQSSAPAPPGPPIMGGFEGGDAGPAIAPPAAGPPLPVPMGGAPPMPQPAAPMMPPDPTEMGAMAGAPEPPAPPMGAGGDPLTGGADPLAASNPVMSAQQTVASIAEQIKAANPDITPEQLFDATNLHIEQMKGVRNDVKDYMQGQVEMAKIQMRLQIAEQRLAGQQYVADRGYEGRVDSAGIRGDAARDVAGTQAGARIGAARIGGDSRVQSAQIGADSRRDVAGTNADARITSSANDANARMYGADQGYRGRVDAASAMTQPKPNSKPVQKPKIATSRTGGSGRRGGTSYTPESLKAAVANGKLPRAQAEQIARSHGWIQ